MTPGEMIRYGWENRSWLAQEHLVHAGVVVIVLIMATIYAIETGDHSGNVWIVYGSAIGYAAGRSGTSGRQPRKADTRAVPR